MRALLLAAGLGTRLRPITNTIPKCLVPIHGRPLIDYWLDLLLSSEIERVLINTHYFAEAMENHLAGSPWRARLDTIHETELLGTGGTLVANCDYFAGGPLLLAHADNLTDFDVAALLKTHTERPEGCLMTMLSFRTDDPRSCGILELDDQNRVITFHEKVESPPGNLANGAVYVIEQEFVAFAAKLTSPSKRFVDLSTEVLPKLVGRILVYEHLGYHRDIGNPESLARAHREFPVPVVEAEDQPQTFRR